MLPAATPFHRLSVEDVYRMVDAGVLQEDDRVELIDGVLVDMTPPSAAHSAAVAWLTQHFVGSVGEREVRVQDLLLVEGGFLVPDLMVIDPPPRDRHPSTAALVVEVAVTTHSHDAWKASRYARAGVTEYWIVDLPGRTVIVHSSASPDGYGQTTRHGEGDRIASPVGAPVVDISALLGPRPQ
jgi:Uma2 family endonuclease